MKKVTMQMGEEMRERTMNKKLVFYSRVVERNLLRK